mgnify:CR=1 FL=1
MGLLEAAKRHRSSLTLSILKELFEKSKEDIRQYTVEENGEEVAVDGVRFVAINGELHIIGVCPECTQDVPGQRIRKFSDIADGIENFKPIRHHCLRP